MNLDDKAETALMELAYQIKKYLHENNIDESSFAQKIGVTPTTVGRALSEKEIPVKDMQKICDTLGLSLDSLRCLPGSANFQNLQQLILAGTVQNKKLDEESVMAVLGDLPQYEQSRNLRWMKQSIEHPELYARSNEKPPRCSIRKYVFQKIFGGCPITSPICFTRHISPKQRKVLENMIEESRKNECHDLFHSQRCAVGWNREPGAFGSEPEQKVPVPGGS